MVWYRERRSSIIPPSESYLLLFAPPTRWNFTRGTGFTVCSSSSNTVTTMSAVAPSRLYALTKLRCSVFQTTFNPLALRTGAKYLKQKLRGPAIINYYPTKLNISRLARAYPELDLIDEAEVERFEDVTRKQKRGKGAPKKARTKGTSHMNCILLVWLLTVSNRH